MFNNCCIPADDRLIKQISSAQHKWLTNTSPPPPILDAFKKPYAEFTIESSCTNFSHRLVSAVDTCVSGSRQQVGCCGSLSVSITSPLSIHIL